jgi:hypothetical protein
MSNWIVPSFQFVTGKPANLGSIRTDLLVIPTAIRHFVGTQHGIQTIGAPLDPNPEIKAQQLCNQHPPQNLLQDLRAIENNGGCPS